MAGRFGKGAASFCGLPSPIGNLYLANLRPVFGGRRLLAYVEGKTPLRGLWTGCAGVVYWRGGSAYGVRIVFASFAVGMSCRIPSGGRGAVWGYPDAGNLH